MKAFYLFIGFLFLLAVPRAAAQSGSIVLEVEAGFGGTFKSGAWAPITITATNSGADARGHLQWRWSGGGTRFAQAIELPRGAKKRLVLPVLVDTFGGDAHVELLDGTRVLAGTRVRYNQLDGGALVVGVLSDAGTSLPELAGMRNPTGSATTLVRLDTAALPERWELLQTLDLLFVHATDTTTWSDAQRGAVEQWVADGGRVVVGGDRPATAAGIGRLLPAAAGARAGDAALADLRPALNWAPRAGAAPVPVLGLEPAPGATVMAAAATGQPLIVRRDYGRGALIQTAFDLAAPAAQGEPLALWERLLPQTGTQFQWLQLRSNGDSVLRQALSLPALRLPSIWTLLGFLGFYIFLVGPANYLLLRRFDRREWAYLTIPATVALFTLGAYGLGASGRGGSAIVSGLSVVRAASASDTGSSLTYLGIFSPGRRDYRVGFGPDVLVANTSSFGSRGNELQVVRGEAAVELPSLLVDVGALRPLLAEQPLPAPVVAVTVRHRGPTDIRLDVENRSDSRLEDAAVVVGESIYKIPDIAARERRMVQIDPARSSGGMDFRSGGVIERAEAINVLRWSLFAPIPVMEPGPAVPAQPFPEQAEPPVYLLAWSRASQVGVTLDGVRQEVHGETLFLWTAAK